MSGGDGDNSVDRCWLVICGIMLMTISFMVCSMTVWKDAMFLCIFSIIESLFAWSCSANSCLKDASISSLNVLLFFFNKFRKSSWENVDTIVDSSFVMDEVADVSLESFMVEGEYFFVLLSMSGNDVAFAMSYEARMCRLKAFCGGCENWMVEGVDSF